MKISGKIIALRATASKSGKTMLFVTDGKMLIVSNTVHSMCANGEIDEVEFEPNGELTMTDGSKLQSMQVKDVKESTSAKLSKLAKLNDSVESLGGIDKVQSTVAALNALTF